MAQYTKYVTVDSVVRLRCMEMGYNHMHRWGDNYLLAREGVYELAKSGFPIRGMQTKFITLENGRAWIPAGLSSIARVGVLIGGHFQPMLMDNNMVERPGDCGGFSDQLPINPDIPAIRAKTQLPTLYTGSITGSGWPWLWAGGWAATMPYGGIPGWPGGNTGLYRPGMNRQKSIYGYYRMFAADGYILVDATTAATFGTIVVEAICDPLQDGVVNWVPELCKGYLLAWMKYKLTELEAETDTKQRPMVRSSYNLWCAERIKLNNRECSPPPADLWAAVCLMT